MSDNDSKDTNENPLTGLEVSKDDLDRNALFNVLDGVVNIVKETGDFQPTSEFSACSNEEKFLMLLFARRAADDLDHLDTVGAESSWFTQYIDVDDSRIRQYTSNYEFVENDPDAGGYHVPGFRIQEAIDPLEGE